MQCKVRDRSTDQGKIVAVASLSTPIHLLPDPYIAAESLNPSTSDIPPALLRPLLRLPLFRGCRPSKTAESEGAFVAGSLPLAGNLLVEY